MSNTYKHKGKGYWNSGFKDKSKKEVKAFLNQADRHNFEKGYFKALKIKEIEKESDKELRDYGVR